MKPRAAKLETATARRRLAVRKKPYYVPVSPGIHLGYRRNEGAGTWSVRVVEHSAEWIKRLALADDLEPADGTHVLTYWQAIDAARALARRQPGDESGPGTVAEALERYGGDLKSRGGDPGNVSRVLTHLGGALAGKPVSLLTSNELRKWRDHLIDGGLAAGTVNRITIALKAALELAAKHDPRITNQRAWKLGLAALPSAHRARNVILTDDEVMRFIDAAYAHDRATGILVETAAVTGARASQLARLVVGDLQADRARVMMPRADKGRVRGHKNEKRPVPITPELTAILREEAAGQPATAPLLRSASGEAWGHSAVRHGPIVRDVVIAAGLDPATVTLGALRHSSIVRQLLANVPIRVVAVSHDTSVVMIEKTYSAHIAEHSDEIARRALLQRAVPTDANVVILKR